VLLYSIKQNRPTETEEEGNKAKDKPKEEDTSFTLLNLKSFREIYSFENKIKAIPSWQAFCLAAQFESDKPKKSNEKDPKGEVCSKEAF